MKRLCLSLFTLLCLSVPYTAANCQLVKIDDKHSSNLLKRLEPIKGSQFEDTFHDENTGDNYKYTLRICSGVEIAGVPYSDVGVMQERLPPGDDHTKTIIGSIKGTMIKGGTDWILLTYTNGARYTSHCNKNNSEAKRQAHIMIVCDRNAVKGQFKVLYENNKEDEEEKCFYMMELSSSVACNDQDTGLSSGSVFLIVFFSITSAYLLFGAIYKRCIYGSKGWDQIPNIGFWKTCGSLQADGCDFLCRCTHSGYTSNTPYQGVADDQLDEEIDDEHLLPM